MRLRDAEARREVGLVRIHQPSRITVLSTDKGRWHTVIEDEVAVGVGHVPQRTHVFVAQPDVDSCVVADAPLVLRKAIRIPLTQVHLRNAGLTLADHGHAEHEACECGAGAVIGKRLAGEAAGELVITAILEEAPHRPDKPLIRAAKLQAVASALPAQGVAAFDDSVPGVHGSGREAVP